MILYQAHFFKRNACEFSFYEDKIVITPMGWYRFFNNSEIIIFKEDILTIKDGVRFIV